MAQAKQTIEFQAKDPAYLNLQGPVTLADLDRVFTLYLPFLGVKAYALYYFLVQESQSGTKQWNDHFLLLDTLTLSLPDFLHGRQALEAVGLLKTFYQEAGAFRGYTYQIQPPMSAHAFFEEDLLSALLFYYVGEDRFQVLANRFTGQPAGQTEGENVTNLSVNFLELFNNPVVGQQPPVKVAKSDSLVDLDLSQKDFDYQAMVALVHGTTADLLAKDRQLILSQQILYGLNEAELATAITRNVNLDDHQLNRTSFMTYLQNQWGQGNQPNKLSERDRTTINSQRDQNAPKNQSAKQSADHQGQSGRPTANQSAGLDKLYQAANLLSPIDFLRQIKENNHGYVTKAESQLLTQLIQQNVLPVPVINILIYQVMINMDNTDLKRNLVDSIVNDWAKNQVDTAPKAVAAIKSHQEQQKKRSQNKQSQYQGRYNRYGQKVEPKMAKNDQLQTQASQGDDTAAMMALLENRKTKN